MIADDIKILNDQQTDLEEIDILDGSPPYIIFSVVRAKNREQDICLTMRETRLSFFASLVTASCSNIPIWVSVIYQYGADRYVPAISRWQPLFWHR